MDLLRPGLFTGFYLVGHGCFTLLLREFGSFEVLLGVCRFCLLLYLVLIGQFGALTAQLGRYSRVVVAHIRMGTDLLLGRKSQGTGVTSEFVEGSCTLDGALVR